MTLEIIMHRMDAVQHITIATGFVFLFGMTGGAVPQAPPQIQLGVTAAQRQEAARALVPLLQEVKRRAQSAVTTEPGVVPDSPFAGTQTTLFAFTLSKRTVPVDSRVVAAMDRLLAWNMSGPGTDQNAALFDKWLAELTSRSAVSVLLAGKGVCDTACVVKRMTTLDESWGASPRNRAEVRDEAMLDALAAVVTK